MNAYRPIADHRCLFRRPPGKARRFFRACRWPAAFVAWTAGGYVALYWASSLLEWWHP